MIRFNGKVLLGLERNSAYAEVDRIASEDRHALGLHVLFGREDVVEPGVFARNHSHVTDEAVRGLGGDRAPFKVHGARRCLEVGLAAYTVFVLGDLKLEVAGVDVAARGNAQNFLNRELHILHADRPMGLHFKEIALEAGGAGERQVAARALEAEAAVQNLKACRFDVEVALRTREEVALIGLDVGSRQGDGTLGGLEGNDAFVVAAVTLVVAIARHVDRDARAFNPCIAFGAERPARDIGVSERQQTVRSER